MAKVFAIPELVENILRLGSESKHTHNPAKNLFVLQRVNKFFKHVICGSPLLQRRMFLRKFPADTTFPSWWSPVKWMLRLLRLKYGYHAYLECHYKTLEIGVARRKVLQTELPIGTSAWLHPDASWRKMKIYVTEDCNLEAVEAYSEGHYRDYVSAEGPYRNYADFDGFDQQTDLGQLADWVVQRAGHWWNHGQYGYTWWEEEESDEDADEED